MGYLRFIGLALFVMGLASAPVYAKRGGWGGQNDHAGHNAGRLEMMKLVLDLTPEQETAISEIIVASREQSSELRKSSAKHRQEIRNLVEAEELDEARLRQVIREQAEVRTNMMIARHGTRAKIDKVLSPEQQQKHRQLRQKRMAQKGKWRLTER